MSRYIEIGVGSPDTKQAFGIAPEITYENIPDAGNFTSCAISSENNCRVCGKTFTDADSMAYIINHGIHFKREDSYSIINNSPEFPIMLTIDQTCDPVINWQEVPVGEKPTNWDNESYQHFFTKHQSTGGSITRTWYQNANATWDANTQYYYNGSQYNFFWVKKGNRRLRFGIGDVGTSFDAGIGRMSNLVLSGNEQLTGSSHRGQSEGFWTVEDVNDQGEVTATKRLTNTSSGGTGDSYSKSTVVGEPTGIDDISGGTYSSSTADSPSRYLFGYRYTMGWRNTITDAQKNEWRNALKNTFKIKNATVAEFGFLNCDGHRYFGIWVVTPKIDAYVGYERYPVEGTGGSRHSTSIYTAETSAADLRNYKKDVPYSPSSVGPYSAETVPVEQIEFLGIEVDKLGITIEEKEGKVPPPDNPNPDASLTWPKLTPTYLRGRNFGTLAGPGENGFHIYCADTSTFKSLQGQLWNWGSPLYNIAESLTKDGYVPQISTIGTQGSGIISMIKGLLNAGQESRIDPLSAVMFQRAMPKFIADSVTSVGSNLGEIRVAGVKTGLYAHCASQEVWYYPETINTESLLTDGYYLNLSPYSQAEIYLPYIGVVQLDPTDFVGGSIQVVYNFNLITGACSAELICTGAFNDYPTQYGPYSGDSGFSFPIAQKDANSFQREMGYMKAMGSVATGVFGAAAGIGGLGTSLMNQGLKEAGNGIKDLTDTFLMKQIFRGSQIGTGVAGVTVTDNIYVIVTTPKPKYNSYEDISKYGMTSGEIKTVGECSGYCKFKYVDVSGIQATADEIEAIKGYLMGGVYL